MTLMDFCYKDGKLTPSFRVSGFTPKEKLAHLVKKIVVVGMETSPVSVTAKDDSELGFEFNESSHVLTVKKPIIDIFDPLGKSPSTFRGEKNIIMIIITNLIQSKTKIIKQLAC